MLSTIILSAVSILQRVKFDYLYTIIGFYFAILWLCYILWLWNDLRLRFDSLPIRIITLAFFSLTFVFGFFLYLLIRPPKRSEDDFYIDLEREYLKFETFGMGPCDICGFDLRPDFFHCPSCGKKLREKCQRCKKVIELEWNHCPYCNMQYHAFSFHSSQDEQNIRKRKQNRELLNTEILHASLAKVFHFMTTVYEKITNDKIFEPDNSDKVIHALNKPLEIKFEDELRESNVIPTSENEYLSAEGTFHENKLESELQIESKPNSKDIKISKVTKEKLKKQTKRKDSKIQKEVSAVIHKEKEKTD